MLTSIESETHKNIIIIHKPNTVGILGLSNIIPRSNERYKEKGKRIAYTDVSIIEHHFALLLDPQTLSY